MPLKFEVLVRVQQHAPCSAVWYRLVSNCSANTERRVCSERGRTFLAEVLLSHVCRQVNQMGLVKWGSYDPKQAAQEQEDAIAPSDFMKLTEGRNVVRILPPKAGENSPFKIVRQHFIKMPGAANPVVFVCPRHHGGDRCPACEESARYRASGLKVDRDKAWELSPKLRVFMNVIDRKDESAGPKLLGVGKTIFDELTALRQDVDAGGDYTHPTEGFDVIIERTGTGKNDTEYATRLARAASPISKDSRNIEVWYEAMSDLKQQAVVRPYADLVEDLGLDGGRSTSAGRSRLPRGRTIDTEAEVVDDEDDDLPM